MGGTNCRSDTILAEGDVVGMVRGRGFISIDSNPFSTRAKAKVAIVQTHNGRGTRIANGAPNLNFKIIYSDNVCIVFCCAVQTRTAIKKNAMEKSALDVY